MYFLAILIQNLYFLFMPLNNLSKVPDHALKNYYIIYVKHLLNIT